MIGISSTNAGAVRLRYPCRHVVLRFGNDDTCLLDPAASWPPGRAGATVRQVGRRDGHIRPLPREYIYPYSVGQRVACGGDGDGIGVDRADRYRHLIYSNDDELDLGSERAGI